YSNFSLISLIEQQLISSSNNENSSSCESLFSDETIEICGMKYNVHKCILFARCKEILNEEKKRKLNESINLPFSAKSFIFWIYNGSFPFLNNLSNSKNENSILFEEYENLSLDNEMTLWRELCNVFSILEINDCYEYTLYMIRKTIERNDDDSVFLKHI